MKMSDFKSSDYEEITELANDEEEVPEDNIDDDFSSSDDEPLCVTRSLRYPIFIKLCMRLSVALVTCQPSVNRRNDRNPSLA